MTRETHNFKESNLILCLTLAGCLLFVNAVMASENAATRMELTPDLMQTDKLAKLPFGGKPHCGPVAASNAMVFLSNKGYPKLSKNKFPTKEEQGKLVISIAQCMKTTRKMGTTENGFLSGLETYINSCGYKIKSIKYQGWQKVASKYDTGIKKPHPSEILANFNDKTQIFLKIGWYKFCQTNNQYVRFAGHWVVVVDAKNTKQGLLITIHDSAPRSGQNKTHERVSLTQIQSGTIVSGWTKPFSAKGMYLLGNELKIKKKADFGILDGMVILKMP